VPKMRIYRIGSESNKIKSNLVTLFLQNQFLE